MKIYKRLDDIQGTGILDTLKYSLRDFINEEKRNGCWSEISRINSFCFGEDIKTNLDGMEEWKQFKAWFDQDNNLVQIADYREDALLTSINIEDLL